MPFNVTMKHPGTCAPIVKSGRIVSLRLTIVVREEPDANRIVVCTTTRNNVASGRVFEVSTSTTGRLYNIECMTAGENY